MSDLKRRILLLGSAAGLALLAATTQGIAQQRGPVPADAIDGGGYDDDRLYQDQNGALYRKRGGTYVPYGGRVEYGRPAPERDTPPAQSRRNADRAPVETVDPAETVERTPAPGQLSAKLQAAVNRPVDDGPIDHAKAYAAITDDPFPVPAFNWKKTNPAFLRQEVAYNGNHQPGTIVVDPRSHHLYLVLPNGRARRYGVGVGKQGFSWSGASTVNSKQAWPDWYPPKEMIARRPDLQGQIEKLQSGLGVPGGSRNPLGARAMYLWQDNKDTLFRIHGTTEPETIGRSVSSGCIRMINQDAIDLFGRVGVGAKVVVLN